MVQEVQSLNKKIESINVQRTKAEAKVEMLRKQLAQEVVEYKKTYRVDLSDSSFAKLSGKVKAELSKVSDEIKAEFELKQKVVQAIDEGRYEDAYKLLGIEVEQQVEVSEKISETVVTPTDEIEIGADFGIDLGDDIEVEDKGNDDIKITLDDDDEIEIPIVEDDDDEVDGGVMLDDIGKSSGTGKKPISMKGQGALDAVESIEVVDDEDEISIPDMGDNDWGFGDILSGTQFDTN